MELTRTQPTQSTTLLKPALLQNLKADPQDLVVPFKKIDEDATVMGINVLSFMQSYADTLLNYVQNTEKLKQKMQDWTDVFATLHFLLLRIPEVNARVPSFWGSGVPYLKKNYYESLESVHTAMEIVRRFLFEQRRALGNTTETFTSAVTNLGKILDVAVFNDPYEDSPNLFTIINAVKTDKLIKNAGNQQFIPNSSNSSAISSAEQQAFYQFIAALTFAEEVFKLRAQASRNIKQLHTVFPTKASEGKPVKFERFQRTDLYSTRTDLLYEVFSYESERPV
jgi:hypothetical protein